MEIHRKTVLITGATGFLGEYLVKEFIPYYKVRALGRNESRKSEIEGLGAVFCQGDFTDGDVCGKYFEDVDYVIHAGALSTVWGSWAAFYKTNVSGTRNVAQLCRTHHVKRLVFVSSPSIYSEKRDRLNIGEEEFNPDNKLNNYIRSKIMAEQVLKEFDDLYTVIIRPRGLIGKGDTSLVPRLLEANRSIGIPLFKGGINLVDITCVENVAYALRLCVEAENIRGEVFNITNGEPIEFKAILELFLQSAGLTPKYLTLPLPFLYSAASAMELLYKLFHVQKEPRITKYTICTLGYSQTLNIDRARNKLGYSPRLPLKDGVKNYAERS